MGSRPQGNLPALQTGTTLQLPFRRSARVLSEIVAYRDLEGLSAGIAPERDAVTDRTLTRDVIGSLRRMHDIPRTTAELAGGAFSSEAHCRQWPQLEKLSTTESPGAILVTPAPPRPTTADPSCPHRRQRDRDELVAGDKVGVAEADIDDPYQHFPRPRVVEGGRLQGGGAWRPGHGGLNVHGRSLRG